MKKFIVSLYLAMSFMAVVSTSFAQNSTTTVGSGPVFRQTQNGTNVPQEMITVCLKHPEGGCEHLRKHCRKETLTITASSSAPTFNWTPQPTIVTQVVMQPVIIQQVQQPVVIEQPVMYTPRTAYYSSPLVSVSASIGISSYGGYYPTTYWQQDSRCQEYRNIAETRYSYDLGGGRSYNSGYGGGIRPMPPVRYMPGVNGVQLGGYGGNCGGGRRH